MNIYVTMGALVAVLLLAPAAMAQDEDDRDRRIEELERTVRELKQQVEGLGADTPGIEKLEVEDLESRIRALEAESEKNAHSWTKRFTFGGYGEMHLNFAEGSGGDLMDYHRWVLYLGYAFNDRVKFNSELELEHAFVADGAGGELVFEQLYIDFLLTDAANIRVGRFLTPLGIINQKHEPTSFNGVERPFFSKYIIPTTWSADGLGLYGNLSEHLKYQAYLVAGLDGSKFSATDGIRSGRMKERPGVADPALTGRIDWFPLATSEVTARQVLRAGLSVWYGGIYNGNKGKNPGVGDRLLILSADFEYSVSVFDFRGVVAWQQIDGAEEIGNNVAEEIFGWYLEAAAHILPESLARDTDLVFFVRYERFDTQWRMPRGVDADPRGNRHAVTTGFTWFILPNLVAKIDYQFVDDDSDEGLPDLLNLGLGWAF